MPPKTAEKTTDKSAALEAKAAETAKVAAGRQRDLDAAISSITKAYGEGSIMRLGNAQALKRIAVIPTGALAVDLALGVGGVPRGRVVEIFGPESSGKTTLMLHVIANAQKAGGLAAFIDLCARWRVLGFLVLEFDILFSLSAFILSSIIDAGSFEGRHDVDPLAGAGEEDRGHGRRG